MKTDITTIKRKSLLYKTKVEYSDWTINHIVGCTHGCKFPCYAMLMAKKFGWIENYEDWRKIKIVSNALELLEKEITRYKSQINFVHLCFMSDPFMYDLENKKLVPEIKELTLQIIEKLNKEGIRVTTLTKGIYPEEILDRKRFLQGNEYGITLVSLNNDFKKIYEPFSANYEDRINSLRMVSKAGFKTWISIEPYPTPAIDETAGDIDNILDKIKFVNKIVFGKLNYNKLANNSDDFYKKMAAKVIDFCKKNNIKYYIKRGISLNECNTK